MSASQCTLREISTSITKGTTPTTMGRPFVEEGINFIKAEALNGDTSLERSGFAFIDEGTHRLLQRSILEENDVLVTIAGANTGRCGFVREIDLPANTNQAVGIVRINHESADPRADWKFLLNSEFNRPSKAVLALFNDSMKSIRTQLKSLALHNQQLIRARDLLLPRLINGKAVMREEQKIS